MAERGEEREERVEVDGVPTRVLMGIDANGNKRIIRCDEDGFLLVKAVQVDEEVFDDEGDE